MKIGFPVYNWDESGWVNSRRWLKNEAQQATLKMSRYRGSISNAETLASRDPLLANSYSDPMWGSSNVYISVQDYEANVLDTIKVPGVPDTEVSAPAGYANLPSVLSGSVLGTTMDTIAKMEPARTIAADGAAVGSDGLTYDVFASINSVELIDFIRQYQVEDKSEYLDVTGTPVPYADVPGMLTTVRGLITSDVVIAPSVDVGTIDWDEAAFDLNPITDSVTDDIAVMTTNGYRIYNNTTVATTGTYALVRSDYTASVIYGYTKPLGNIQDPSTVQYGLGTKLVAGTDRDIYVTLKAVLKSIVTNMKNDASVYSYQYGYLVILISKAEVLTLIDNLIAEANKKLDVFNTAVTAAKDTPVGVLLDGNNQLESMLQLDISRSSSIRYSCRVQNYKGQTSYSDDEKYTSNIVFNNVTERWPEWKNYFVAVMSPYYLQGTVPELYYACIGYIPKWNVIKDLPNSRLSGILSMCLRTDIDMQKPPRNWTSVVMAIVAAIVITIATWGSGTPGAIGLVMTTLAWASAISVYIATVTRLSAWMYFAENLGYVSMALGGYQTLATKGITMVAVVQKYAMTIITKSLNYIYTRDLQNLQDRARATQKKLDDVREIQANELVEKQDSVRKWVHGGAINAVYTDQYSYSWRYEY